MLLFSLCFVESFPQSDLILMRDGTEKKVKIVTVTNEKTTYCLNSQNEESVPNILVYMIKYRQRGNVFFTEEGERISGDGNGRIPTGAAAIYLLEGKELIGYNIVMDEYKISFTETKKSSSQTSYIAKSKIFLIKYPDGTKDIMNDFEMVKREREELELKKKKWELLKTKEEESKIFPREVVIKTTKGNTIRAVLLSDDGEFISYKKIESKEGLQYKMKRINIMEMDNVASINK